MIGLSTDPERLTLSEQRRLRRKADFDAVYSRGRRFGTGLFAVAMRMNDLGLPRLGLAVATKVAGNSVERNRIRRVIRESFRLHQHSIPAVDVVVTVRARARSAVNAELRAGLEDLWVELKNRCAASPTA